MLMLTRSSSLSPSQSHLRCMCSGRCPKDRERDFVDSGFYWRIDPHGESCPVSARAFPLVPCCHFSITNSCSMMVPHLKASTLRLPSFLGDDVTRWRILFLSALVVALISLVLLSVSDALYLQGNFSLASKLFTPALVIISAYYLATASLCAYFFQHLKKHFTQLLKKPRDTQSPQDEEKQSQLRLDFQKASFTWPLKKFFSQLFLLV